MDVKLFMTKSFNGMSLPLDLQIQIKEQNGNWNTKIDVAWNYGVL